MREKLGCTPDSSDDPGTLHEATNTVKEKKFDSFDPSDALGTATTGGFTGVSDIDKHFGSKVELKSACVVASAGKLPSGARSGY